MLRKGKRAMEKEKCEASQPCETCQTKGTCSSGQKEQHEQERLQERLYHIRHRIMVMSGKGGVGKSTVAANLAASLALEGLSVGVLDADIHGPNIPRMLGVEMRPMIGSDNGVQPVEPFPGLKVISMGLLSQDTDMPIIWRGPLKHTVIKQFLSDVNWGDLDYLIIDLPPGTGDEPLSVAHLMGQMDGSIIVTTPQDVALLDSRKAVGFSRQLKLPVIGIVENMGGMRCPHCGKEIDLFKVGGGEKAAMELGVPFLGRIPIDPQMVTQCDEGKPFVLSCPYTEAKKAYDRLRNEVLEATKENDKKKSATI
jgi:Mrp family chromosome partitioning ATPase